MHGTIESSCKVELRDISEIATFAAPLRDLAARSLIPNIFYEPAFAAAAASVFGRKVLAGLVWSKAERLVGFFPVYIERWRYGWPMPILVAWTHPYAPLGVPLIDRSFAQSAIAAWFDYIASNPTLPRCLLMPLLPVRGEMAAAIEGVLGRTGGRSAAFGRHERAMLAPTGDHARYLEKAISRKKRKDLNRQRRLLMQHGTLSFTDATRAPTLTSALDAFLALEAGGWKGRAGTAARCDASTRDFVVGAIGNLASEGQARVVLMSVDAKAIAATIVLRSGNYAWLWKIAYDEAFSRASPGVQLVLEVTQRLLDDPQIERVDSCASPNHPMIDKIWLERFELADQLISMPGCSSIRYSTICALETVRRAGENLVKRLRAQLRRWRGL